MSAELKVVVGMALLRLVSATIEMTAALLMLRLRRVETAFQINAALGLVGPAIFTVISLVGLAGLAGRLPVHRMLLIVAGIGLILLATRR